MESGLHPDSVAFLWKDSTEIRRNAGQMYVYYILMMLYTSICVYISVVIYDVLTTKHSVIIILSYKFQLYAAQRG